MSANPIVSFDFDQQPVRTIERNGEPWFVLADVCRVLGISNSRDAASRLDEDEKGVGLTDTLGGGQDMTVINESGLYTVILRSRAATTPGTVQYRFRRWVTGEVLPAIRRTGRYDATGQRAAAQLEHVDRTARRRELPRLIEWLRRETNAETRSLVHAIIVQNCEANGLTAPPIDAIGRAAPNAPDVLEPFWAGIGVLRARGVLIDHSRVAGRLALNLPEVADAFAKTGVRVGINRALRSALRLSQQPRYIMDGAVNSAERRKSVSCFVFEAN